MEIHKAGVTEYVTGQSNLQIWLKYVWYWDSVFADKTYAQAIKHSSFNIRGNFLAFDISTIYDIYILFCSISTEISLR